ncbi:MAG: molybdopterin-dependent oxidoreductase, partial [Chloroflexi bacterium]|nr:molybdopterin-dependent oxidoreductase [Chloroflexota bacterium]
DGLGALLAQPEGRIVRGPFLEESPLHAIDGLITPTRLHFIRNHTPTPLIDQDTWKLTVDGEVDRPLELSYEDILRLPSKSMNILLECASNSRSRYSPLAEGTAWTDGAVSVAEWTGVSLGDLLRSAGIRPNAVHVVAQGGDAGKVERGLPVDVALGPDTLLAYAMNGDTLPADHGFPLRLVVPGWIGVASVKWLERLTVIPRPLEGAYQTVRYILDGPDYPDKPPATVLPVKSVVARPYTGTTIEPGLASISGFAWSGSGKITRVEISLNGGASWSDARVLEPIDRLHWARWDFPWDAAPGQYTLLSRATDETGATQPRSVPWNRLGYLYHASVPVPIGVGQPAPEAASVGQAPASAAAVAGQAPADRGQEVFAQQCADCHGADGGGTPRGARVIGQGTNVVAYSPVELDRYIRTSMPQYDPGSLSPQEYDEVIAYLRRANNLP